MDMARREVSEKEPEWNKIESEKRRNPYLAGQDRAGAVKPKQREQRYVNQRQQAASGRIVNLERAQRPPSSGRSVSGRTSSGREVSGRTSSGRSVSEGMSSGRAVSGRMSSGRSVSEGMSSGRAVSGRTSSGRSVSGRTSSGRSVSEGMSSGRAVSGRMSSGRASVGTDRRTMVQPECFDAPARRPADRRAMDSQRAARMARQRRLRILRMQRLVALFGICCILGLLGTVLILQLQKPQVDGAAAPLELEQQVEEPVKLVQGISADAYAKHPDWEENFLTPNEYSRPGDPLTEVTNVFVHYTANPGTSAAQNRSYFEQQKDTHERSVSSHFIIGYEGEIIQCVPLDEIAYAVQTRNNDSISIECCYLASDGSFTQETYDSLIKLLSWLTDTYNLDSEDILRHYDCGGKKCPIYYTENEDAWERLKKDVEETGTN